MNLMVKIGYNEILNLVKQLQTTINQDFMVRKANEEISELQNFLLTAPVMTNSEFKEFKENRKSFDKWRMKN